uniref:Uncharacterized protein n=1 Tax=Setaria viridis TaxID=4556 RepID=A0A4U6W7K4_SETVI|nr:hypothetical protein SEVIR_1G075500v2 [Setaria viridis]
MVHMFDQIEIVCAWLPVCHTCSPTRGVVACCGWRARGQACILCSILLSVFISTIFFMCSRFTRPSVLSFCLFLQVPIEEGLMCTSSSVFRSCQVTQLAACSEKSVRLSTCDFCFWYAAHD